MSRRLFVFAFAVFAAVGMSVLYFIPKRPGLLAAKPTEVRLEMKFGAKEEVFVGLENIGGMPLSISEVSSSCGCTVGTPESKQLGPGESTRLKVDVRANSLGRKDAIIVLAYESSNQRNVVRIPVVMLTSEIPGTRVLSYPKDLAAQSDAAKNCRTEFEIRTLEKAEAEPDLVKITSSEERCQFQVLGVKATDPDRDGKTERTYQCEVVIPPSEPFAAIATMQFREPLGVPAGNIAIIARPKIQTRVIPSTVELPIKLAEDARKRHEVLLISEEDIEDWKVADKQFLPDWLSVEVEKLRSNITRVTIADSRSLGTKVDDTGFELRLNSSIESVSLPLRVRH